MYLPPRPLLRLHQAQIHHGRIHASLHVTLHLSERRIVLTFILKLIVIEISLTVVGNLSLIRVELLFTLQHVDVKVVLMLSIPILTSVCHYAFTVAAAAVSTGAGLDD